MARLETIEFLTEYLREVGSFLPLLIDAIHALEVNPADRLAWAEMRRLVHLFCEASAAAGVDGLIHMAACMETAMDRVPVGVELPPLVAAMTATVERFEGLIRGLERGELVDQDLLVARTREDFVVCAAAAGSQAGDPPGEDNNGDAMDYLLAAELEVPAGLIFSEPWEAQEACASLFVPAGSSVWHHSAPAGGPLFRDAEREQLLAGFHEEAEEHLLTLQEATQRLESAGPNEGATLKTHWVGIAAIRRAVHTIKGASAVVGLDEVAAYAHGVEEFLDQVHDGTRSLDRVAISGLVESLDLLGLLVNSPERAPLAERNAVLARLGLGGAVMQVVDKPQTGPTAATVAAVGESADVAPSVERTPFHDTTLRIPRQRLDTLVGLSNDLLANISSLGRNLEWLSSPLAELEGVANRLKGISAALEQLSTTGPAGLSLSRPFLFAVPTYQAAPSADSNPADRLALIVQAIGESAADAAAIRATLADIQRNAETDLDGQQKIARDLQAELLQARLSPMTVLIPRLRRTVEDVAARLDRQIRLTVSGEQVELDRAVWEKLADPLMHLIRNAVHHGIESPEERLAHGKEAVATISLSGRHEGDQMVIRFADDGKGLDFAAIRDKAGCYDSSLCPHAMDEQQLVDLIFAPGFSIRTVSEMSGRGVGLDVVRENVRDLQGTVTVATSPRAGTTFTIKVPLTVGVVRALIVESGEALWAFALSDISEVRRVDGTNISWEERTIRLGTATLPWYSLPTLLGQVEDPVEVPRPLVLVFSSAGRSVVVSVPCLVGRQEIVVRGLSSQLGAVPGVVGTAVLGDGTVVSVLDPADLIRAARLRADEEAPEVLIDISRPLTVLVVDDSLSVRMLVSRLVAARGWRPLEARDGVEAVRQLDEVWPDCIVLDLEMPRMNGFEFLARLATMPSRRNIPVIMITSRIGRQERVQATRLGVRAVLVKPCRDEELLATICQVTGIAGAGVEGS